MPIAVPGHELVEHHIIQIEQKAADGAGYPDQKHLTAALRLRQRGSEVHPDHLLLLPEHKQAVGAGDDAGEQGGYSDAEDLTAFRKNHKHEKRVQSQIQNTAEGDPDARLAGEAETAYQVGKDIGTDGGDAAENENHQHILAGIAEGVLPRPQQVQKRPHEEEDEKGKGSRRQEPESQAIGRDTRRLVFPVNRQKPWQKRAAAGAEKRPDRNRDVEKRQNQGHARDHKGIIRPADIKRVGQIVDENDQLGGNRRNRHGPDRLADRHLLKYIFV